MGCLFDLFCHGDDRLFNQLFGHIIEGIFLPWRNPNQDIKRYRRFYLILTPILLAAFVACALGLRANPESFGLLLAKWSFAICSVYFCLLTLYYSVRAG